MSQLKVCLLMAVTYCCALTAWDVQKGTSTATCHMYCFITVPSLFGTTQEFVRHSWGKTGAVMNTEQQPQCAVTTIPTRRRSVLCKVWSTFWVGNFFPGSLSDGSGIGDHLAEGYVASILKSYDFQNKLKRPRARENFTACLKRLKLKEILCSDEFFLSYLQSFSLASLSLYVALFPSHLFNILLPSHEPTTPRVGKHTCLFYLIQTFRCTT